MTERFTIRTDAFCPACSYAVLVPFYEGGEQPLATIAWPKTAKEAQGMKRLKNRFMRCVECGHIANPDFDYAEVPYSDKPNLMFNRGANWSGFIKEMQQAMLSKLPDNPTVVEIGHGDGSFLAALSALRPGGKYIGFDPNGATKSDIGNVTLRAELFHPMDHLPELRPDLILMRHVLEHLKSPVSFLEQIAYAANYHHVSVQLYAECPCVDRVLETRRTSDFYYEHNSQFTTQSFTAMHSRAHLGVDKIGHGYDGEVIYAFSKVEPVKKHADLTAESQDYNAATQQSKASIERGLADLLKSGKKVAIWGGTGKSAAFMGRYEVDAKRFPMVVDSDINKVGTFVPGTGQEIKFRDALKENPHEIIVIPPQWRAADIVMEIKREGIPFERILIEHGGKLIDFLSETHPYKKAA